MALAGGGRSGVLALVGRESCLFLAVDAARVPPRQRDGFVALAVRRAAPFGDPEHDVVWLQDHAAVWYWSRERVRDLAPANARRRAEAVYRGTIPAGDAVQLLSLETSRMDGETFVAGVEGRVWRSGHLVASRWWPALPDAAAWQGFARGAGLDHGTLPPEPQPAPLLDRPLSDGGARLAFAGQLQARRPLVAAVVGTLLAAVMAWQVGGIARAAWRTHLLEGKTEALSAGMQRIIEAREQADLARARIDAALALRTPASQTRLLGEVLQITPGAWQLLSWRQPSPEILEVTLRAANPDVPSIVAAWEASPLLQDVTPSTSRRGDELTLQARLTPLSMQLAQAEDAP